MRGVLTALEQALNAAASHQLLPRLVAYLALTPVHFKRACAFAALVDLFAHRIIHGNGEQVSAVGAIEFSFPGNATGEANFVRQEVVKE